MRKFVRLEEPEVLKKNWESYGVRYTNNRLANPAFKFDWYTEDGVQVNHSILPILLLQTQEHCPYCDKFPLHRGDDSIDHFKLKSIPAFYSLVCKWDNLYLACKHCQDSKGSDYNDNLLRPDDINFNFNKFFDYNYTTHEIEINTLETPENQLKALETRRIFDFNHKGQVKTREHAFKRYITDLNPDLDDYNYRFIFE
jgi:thiol-disulfide isomerase/thioredoxin